jgi:isoleucyl-tRNA synthetase
MEKKSLRNKAIKAINETIFYPAKGKERLLSMIKDRPDWCVSRQRSWGVPLPIFINKKTKEPLRDLEVINRIADIYEQEGSDCWFTDDIERFLGKNYNKDEYEKLTDIVEVWFDSGSTHSFVLEKRKELKWPADMYLEGSDQHRGWFHSSLLEACGTRERAPFESILSHGFVVDGKGMKMSKSSGNVISPEDILKNYGADILRAWVAASDYSEDLRVDNTILAQHAESYRKIRNTFRFILGNIHDKFEKVEFKNLNIENFSELESHILHKVFLLDKSIKENLKNYNFHKLYKDLLSFCSLDLSSFYFDIRKDTLYCDDINSKKRKDCIVVLNIILDCLLRWMAPIFVFTTEEIYNLINQDENSIHELNFIEIPNSWNDAKLSDKWKSLYKIKQEVNLAIEEMRTNKEVGSSLEVELEIFINKKEFDMLNGLDLAEYFITSKAKKTQNINNDDQMKIVVKKSTGTKCQRCWKILDGECSRCNQILKGFKS